MHVVVPKPLRIFGRHASIADHKYLLPIVRRATTTGKILLRSRNCSLCLDQEQPDQDQRQRRRLARIRHQSLDRRSGIPASEKPVR